MLNTSAIIVILAVMLPAGFYVFLSLRELKNIGGLRDFFPLTHFLGSEKYGRSTAASGISLATIILVLINLSPVFGFGLFVTIASYAASFVLLYFVAPIILRANPENDTIQTYLGKKYDSPRIRNGAVFFTFIGYMSIFAMELLVGVEVLRAFFGDNVIVFSMIYLAFIILYSLIAGFRAIVATEQWQIRFILIAIFSLFVVFLMLPDSSETGSAFNTLSTAWSNSILPISFAIGIIALNLPATISDSGTWQRLCSTRTENDAKKGLVRAIILFMLMWGALIIAGTLIATKAGILGSFDPSSQSLMSFIMEFLAEPSLPRQILLFIFVLGLFAAMITTADSLLLVAGQLWSVDVLNLRAREISETRKVRTARFVLGAIAIAAFGIFYIFKILELDIVQLIFAIYGAQLAMFPAVSAALFLKNSFSLPTLKFGAGISVICGFIGAWASAIYGKISTDSFWTYNAPVVALVVASTLLIILSVPAWRERHEKKRRG